MPITLCVDNILHTDTTVRDGIIFLVREMRRFDTSGLERVTVDTTRERPGVVVSGRCYYSRTTRRGHLVCHVPGPFPTCITVRTATQRRLSRQSPVLQFRSCGEGLVWTCSHEMAHWATMSHQHDAPNTEWYADVYANDALRRYRVEH
jgi:hypothetical protein